MKLITTSILPVPKIVLFPHASLPFLISDARYIKTLANSIENNELITISLASGIFNENTGFIEFSPQEIATIGRPMLLEGDMKNGPLKILVRGISRVRIKRIVQHIPILKAEVETFPDKIESIQAHNDIEILQNIFNTWVHEILINSEEREIFLEQTKSLNEIIDHLCMFLIQDHELKQLLLECDSLLERLQMLRVLLTGTGHLREDSCRAKAIKNFENIDKITKLAS